MSEIERYRRSLGFRPASGPQLMPAIPVIDACMLRQDAIGWQENTTGRPTGSILWGWDLIAAGVIAQGSNICQLPGPTGGFTAAMGAVNNAAFFRPGLWRLNGWVQANVTSVPARLQMSFLPRDSVTGLLTARPFQGQSAAAGTVAGMIFTWQTGQDRWFEFECYFPESWGVLFVANTALALNDKYSANGAFIHLCGVDDLPAVLDPQLSR